MSKIDEMSEAGPIQVADGAVPNSRPSIRLAQATWALWWVGTILIVLSWIRVVNNTIGWIGFSMAIASSVVSVVARKFWRMPR